MNTNEKSTNRVKRDEPLSKWDAKNSVFVDLFGFSKYQLQLFQAIHPEMTDVKEEDIRELTLNPIILNLPYNDLGILVKNRLLIFIEAQSTWSINILIRILLYLALTYQNLVTERELDLYGSKKADIPEPEFYVVFTGSKKLEKDYISLREDFWCDAQAKIDVVAKVIYAENKNDIIGQYILFCHVLDAQIDKHGRTRTAVQETIRICKSGDILKEYLESRESEVIDIMITLFDQEFATKAYANSIATEKAIQTAVEMCRSFGATVEDAIRRIAEKFNLSQEESSEYVKTYWEE